MIFLEKFFNKDIATVIIKIKTDYSNIKEISENLQLKINNLDYYSNKYFFIDRIVEYSGQEIKITLETFTIIKDKKNKKFIFDKEKLKQIIQKFLNEQIEEKLIITEIDIKNSIFF